MLDFNIEVINNSVGSSVVVTPEEATMPDLLKRAICLVVAHEDSSLMIDGKSLLNWFTSIATKDTQQLAQMLTAPADRLKQLLNEDGAVVSSVFFTVDRSSGKLSVDLNITPYADDEPMSASIYTG